MQLSIVYFTNMSLDYDDVDVDVHSSIMPISYILHIIPIPATIPPNHNDDD